MDRKATAQYRAARAQQPTLKKQGKKAVGAWLLKASPGRGCLATKPQTFSSHLGVSETSNPSGPRPPTPALPSGLAIIAHRAAKPKRRTRFPESRTTHSPDRQRPNHDARHDPHRSGRRCSTRISSVRAAVRDAQTYDRSIDDEMGLASPDISVGMSRVNSIMTFLRSKLSDRKSANEFDCYSVVTTFINSIPLQCFATVTDLNPSHRFPI